MDIWDIFFCKIQSNFCILFWIILHQKYSKKVNKSFYLLDFILWKYKKILIFLKKLTIHFPRGKQFTKVFVKVLLDEWIFVFLWIIFCILVKFDYSIIRLVPIFAQKDQFLVKCKYSKKWTLSSYKINYK